MGWEPDWAVVLTERYIVPWEQWVIPASGYMLAIAIEDTAHTNWPRAHDVRWKAEFEVTDTNHVPLWGQFHWDYPIKGCGIAFPEPLPNMDARGTYILRRIAPEGDLILAITIVSLGVMREKA